MLRRLLVAGLVAGGLIALGGVLGYSAGEASDGEQEAERGKNHDAYVCGQTAENSLSAFDAAIDSDILGESPPRQRIRKIFNLDRQIHI